MLKGYRITIENLASRDLTWSEYQSAMSTARSLDPQYDWDNPLITETTVRTRVCSLNGRPEIVHVFVEDLDSTELP